jgi:hypothetical protein
LEAHDAGRFSYEIVASRLTNDEALALEARVIDQFGLAKNGGPLVNKIRGRRTRPRLNKRIG